MTDISANDLKVRGVASIEAGLADASEAIISVRGHKRFVVMDIAH
ncbi:MAG: type II toxin-antitoxin system Phd/YefM family antitoxin, partial [Methylocystaceae bacterium]|nr:type II toxin-antitoxin system Phd/YefM family antitoxin [Methylocystaceae bacterium]